MTAVTWDFSALTYNVLAQAYVRPSRYRGCEPAALAAGPRYTRLLAKIAEFDADLLCLQEVEAELFEALATVMPTHEAVFEQKRGRPDGCATFVRREHFELVTTHRLHYRACEPGYDHLALVTRLRHGQGELVVANTHLRWQPENTAPGDHLGVLQLDELLALLGENEEPGAAIVIAGDLNALSRSPVIDRAARAGLELAARSLRPWDTALINGRRRKLDYLLHDPRRLQPSPRPLPSLSAARPIPSLAEPSDHLPLLVDFSWC